MRRWICGGNSLIILLLLQILGGEAWATPNADLIQAIQEKHLVEGESTESVGKDVIDYRLPKQDFYYCFDNGLPTWANR